MLNIGQNVYVTCKFYTNGEKFKIYISRKEINRIERNRNGEIVYTAGRHNELHFREIEDGTYQAFGVRQKKVYLTKEEADVERRERWEQEKSRKKTDEDDNAQISLFDKVVEID